MLEILLFFVLAYLAFKFIPVILEAMFKFAVICLGFLAFVVLFYTFAGHLIL
tara:strand:- start:50 stop:205 length:156 start_codon:yes stop_codon:yes gene_type:complete